MATPIRINRMDNSNSSNHRSSSNSNHIRRISRILRHADPGTSIISISRHRM